MTATHREGREPGPIGAARRPARKGRGSSRSRQHAPRRTADHDGRVRFRARHRRARIGGWIFAGMTVALLVAAIAGLPACPRSPARRLAEGVGSAGFTVRRVEIRGAQRVSRLDSLQYRASTSRRWRCRWSTLKGRASRLLQLRLDQGGARLAPAARHAGDRYRRARARGDLAEQSALEPDRRRRAWCSSRSGSRRCPSCRW